MRGYGFPAKTPGAFNGDAEKLVRDLCKWITVGLPFMIHSDGDHVNVVVADAFESQEIMAASAGFKVL